MKASELIAVLQKTIAESGDREVVINVRYRGDDYSEEPIQCVCLTEDGKRLLVN